VNKKWLASLALLSALSSVARGLPQNPDVRHGSVQIQGAAGLLQILQSSPQAIINWSQFNISPAEVVRFLQPGNGVVLNRVTGNQSSLIAGLLEANGKLILLNPNGVLFTQSAQVNAGSLLVSTLNMSDSDFLANNYRLAQDPNQAMAAVVNQGRLEVNDGGYLVLVSPLVHNEGVIVARQGQIALGASTEASLTFDPEGMIQFSLADGYRGAAAPAANPGPVLLAPGQLTDVLAGVVAVDPSQEMTTLQGVQGLLSNAGQISVDGATQAGTIKLDSSLATINTQTGSIQANASDPGGRGGVVEVFSAGTAYSGGALQARGGPGGEGGFIELSALTPSLWSAPDISAPGGTPGVFLLDPTILTLIDTGPGTFDGSLPDLTGDPGAGTVSIQAINAVGSGTVILQATDSILWLDDTIDINLATGVNLVMDAGNAIFVNSNNQIQGSDGSVTLLAGNTLQAPTINTGGPIVIDSQSGDVSLQGNLSSNAAITIEAGGDIFSNPGHSIASPVNDVVSLFAVGNIQAPDIFSEGTIKVESQTGNIVLTGPVSADASVELRAAGDIFTGESLISPGSLLDVTAETFLGSSVKDGFVLINANGNTQVILNISGPNQAFPLSGTGAAALVFSTNPNSLISEAGGGATINPGPNTGRVYVDKSNGPFDDGAPFPPADRINVAKYEPGGTPPTPPPTPPTPPGPTLPEEVQEASDLPEELLRSQLLQSTSAHILNLGNVESYYDVNPGGRGWLPVRNFGLRSAYNIPLYTLELASVQVIDPEEGFWRNFLAQFIIWEDEPDEEEDAL